jgi:hypothetical protein
MVRLAAAVLSAPLFALLAACETGIGAGEELLATVQPAVKAQRCPHCGRIESKRQVPPGATDPHARAVYEYTVRMTDGSSSIFEQALPANWRVGERLTLIRVARPLD